MGTTATATQDDDGIKLHLQGGTTLAIDYNPANNLPTLYLSHNQTTTVEQNLCVLEDTNQNLSVAQKELLRWHFRFGHFNMKTIQQLLKSGALGNSPVVRSASRCEIPRCASCLYGKATKTPHQVPRTTTSEPSSLSKDTLFPGQKVSMDHYSVTERGRLYSSRGRTPADDMYCGGCIFYDHSSGYIHVEHQVTKTAGDTLQSKLKFEQHMYDHGALVQAYHTDNGVFRAKEFNDKILENQQIITFSGVGAHHQNGAAERAIRTIFTIARTMLTHAAIRWPDAITTDLWPMALDYAVWLHNRMPKSTGIAPIDLLTRTTVPRHHLANAHVFGCPTFVLDPTLQGGSMLPKFKPRSRRGVFVGLSQKHSSTVPLVLNMDTSSIGPQFHVVFDDWFTSVNSVASDVFDNGIWENLFMDSRYKYVFDEDDLVDLTKHHERILNTHTSRQQHVRMHQRENGPVEQQQQQNDQQQEQNDLVEQQNDADSDADTVQTDNRGRPIEIEPQENVPPAIPPEPERLERSERNRRPPNRYGYDGTQGYGYIVEVSQPKEENLVNKLLTTLKLKPQRQQVEIYRAMMEINHELNTIEYHDPAAYLAANNSDPDTLKWHQAIKEDDWEQFYEAAQTEIKTLQDIGTWEEVDIKNVPKGTNILPGTWVFKRKRYPDGKLRKHKARYCVRGDKQVAGVDYFETYAPVTSWSTVRLMFTLTIVCKLESVQVDYTNAFAQANLKEDVYITVPQGFVPSDPTRSIVLRLLKSLYGLVQAPRVFYEHLGANLRRIGFLPCVDVDPCLWIHHKKQMVVIIWVDDCLFFHKDKREIHKVIDELGKTMPLTKEENITAFLGIEIKQEGSKYSLTQPRLIERCIEAVKMVDANSAKTPAQTTPLGQDLNGDPFKETWEYASVVGMLMYLANNTRPDIAYATHQCARFTHRPRASHALAVKRIIRYLIGTKDKGLILQPSSEITVDCLMTTR